MRAARLIRAWWSGRFGLVGTVLSVLAAPLGWIWRGATRLRNRRYDLRGGTRVDGVTVVSVGNLAVGGTGKTPFTGWLVGGLVDRGARPAVLSRGYGRDELLLHRKWHPEVPVVADPDRVAGARIARERGAHIVVLDDGFQHRQLARDLDIVLVAVEDAFPGRLLPGGPLREPTASLARADIVVLTRRTASLEESLARRDMVLAGAPDVVTCGVHLTPKGWSDLAGAPADLAPGGVLAVAGIARPETFQTAVEEASAELPELMVFGDHHEYTEGDVARIKRRARGRTIAVTEKDAVKLVAFGDRLGRVRVLSSEIRFDWGLEELLTLVDSTISES